MKFKEMKGKDNGEREVQPKPYCGGTLYRG